MKTDDLKAIAQMTMPFGKYKGTLLIDLPEPYLLWFEKQGMPNGRLGILLQLATEIHRNGLTHIIEPLKSNHINQGNMLCMTPEQLINLLKNTPEAVDFKQVITTIDQYYHYTPATFSNGLNDETVINQAGNNEGSCKIFSFAQINNLNKAQTLSCFGEIYRKDVLMHPDNTDHANIRNFIKYGWEGVIFESPSLALK